MADGLILYSYFRSSCSARIRIALNLKDIPYTLKLINLLKDEHKSAENVAANPLGLVPSLLIQSGPHAGTVITQSPAILEFLEESETYSGSGGRSLLPPKGDVLGRAHVRELASLVACDVQPVTNMRILRNVKALGGAEAEWAKRYMTDGLEAYEKLAKAKAGRFSYGDEITIADVNLVPAVWGAMRFGVDIDALPTVKSVFEEMSKEDAVKKAHWKNQPDCPEELR